MQTPDRNRLVWEYSHKNWFFVFVCALASHENRFWEQKTNLKPNPRGQCYTVGTLGLTELVFLLSVGMALRGSGSCPSCSVQRLEGLCGYESWSSDSMDRDQGSGCSGRPFGRTRLTDGAWFIPETRVAFLAGMWTTTWAEGRRWT